MRPAIEVCREACRETIIQGAAFIAADRAELVAEIVAWLRDQHHGRLQSPIFLADYIEAKFGGRDG